MLNDDDRALVLLAVIFSTVTSFLSRVSTVVGKMATAHPWAEGKEVE